MPPNNTVCNHIMQARSADELDAAHGLRSRAGTVVWCSAKSIGRLQGGSRWPLADEDTGGHMLDSGHRWRTVVRSSAKGQHWRMTFAAGRLGHGLD